MKYKVGDYVIHGRQIYKIVHVNKWFKKYNIKRMNSETWAYMYYVWYPEIIKVKEKEVKGLITFNE